MLWLFGFFLFVIVFFEGTITTLPLTLQTLLVFYVLYKNSASIFLAFISGIILDLLSVRLLGTTSIYFVIFLFLVVLYERKFEINTIPFIILSSFFGSLGFLFLFGFQQSILQAVASSFFAVLLFKVFTVKKLDE